MRAVERKEKTPDEKIILSDVLKILSDVLKILSDEMI